MVLLLSETAVRRLLSSPRLLMPPSIISTNRCALLSISPSSLSDPRADVPPRSIVRYAGTEGGDTLFKPAVFYGNSSDPDLMGIKVVSVRPCGVPASTSLICPLTGALRAVVSSTYLTAVRTAAGSGAAIAECLWRRRAQAMLIPGGPAPNDLMGHLLANGGRPRVVVFGAGMQAEQHVRAALSALNTYRAESGGGATPGQAQSEVVVTIVNRSRDRAESLKNWLLAAETAAGDRVRLGAVHTIATSDGSADSASSAVRRAVSAAHLILLTTGSDVPVLHGRDLNGATAAMICGAGSYTANQSEIDSAGVTKCGEVWIDSPAALEVGDLASCGDRAKVLADVLNPDSSNGTPLSKCVFYKTVGTSVQDVVSAEHVIRLARQEGLGVEVDMS